MKRLSCNDDLVIVQSMVMNIESHAKDFEEFVTRYGGHKKRSYDKQIYHKVKFHSTIDSFIIDW